MWPGTDNSTCCERVIFVFPQIYYVLAMVEDLVLRAVWTLNISVGEAGAKILNDNIVLSLLAVLELFRWVESRCLFVCLFVCL